MPTIHREDGFSFRIYPKDHEPPHVHAVKAGVFARVGLGDAETAPYLIDAMGIGPKDARRAVEIVQAAQEAFLARWREIHGT